MNLEPEENHQFREATLDNLMEGFQLISFDWRYLYLNEAVVKQSKYTKEELLGYTMMEKYPGIEQTPLFSVLRECMHKRVSNHFENEFTYPDQSKGWFELRIQPIPEGLFILSIDITERKMAELKKKEYVEGLEEMIFITSHKVRKPVAQIMGFSHLLDGPIQSQDDLKLIISFMKTSVLSLDNFTRELTEFIHELQQKTNNIHWN